ncbi:DHA2 family multidrug resistance protein [Paraburkholderia bannensis]|uniref:DHA2 family multidrug resistance protein n=1 Tax=Paraburkholderia bannensis TaxID=765414 RepID=A0A7W9U0I1_9BURK|nr:MULTISPECIES: MFS transporter [Paraburkholderia]MBB3259869.1 DHA2 family multidrug resistance protein [Paraburkholderia sp. WP4_3_2]MBB6104821.1 DHA2 family multidrug resistance protein [Paraburkholderia bannensis]
MTDAIIGRKPSLSTDFRELKTRPVAAIFAVLLGAIISTLTSRITVLGLADIRGALGVGFDEGAWINTTFTVAQMFVGPIAVWAAFVMGTRRVLLTGACTFLLAETLLPLSGGYPTFLALQALAGAASGVFVPVTVGFVIRALPPNLVPFGVAAYAMNLEMSLNLSATLEGWYSEHLSWHWLFWQNAVLAVGFIAALLAAMPAEPTKAQAGKGDYIGMLLGATGFSLLYAALDQGERLFWFQSPIIGLLVYCGIVLIAAFIVREFVAEHPGLDLTFFLRRNVALMVCLVVLVRLMVLNTNFIPPLYLSIVRGLRPLQVGETLRWVAIPQFLFAPMVAMVLLRIDPRKIIVTGFATIALAFAMGSLITPDWAETQFIPSQLIQALGQTMALTSIIYYFSKHVTLQYALTFGAVVQTARLFGGQVGATSIGVLERVREQFHSNVLGLKVSLYDPLTVNRLVAESIPFGAAPQSAADIPGSAFALLDRAVRVQATTLALADNYRFAFACAVSGVCLALLLKRIDG